MTSEILSAHLVDRYLDCITTASSDKLAPLDSETAPLVDFALQLKPLQKADDSFKQHLRGQLTETLAIQTNPDLKTPHKHQSNYSSKEIFMNIFQHLFRKPLFVGGVLLLFVLAFLAMYQLNLFSKILPEKVSAQEVFANLTTNLSTQSDSDQIIHRETRTTRCTNPQNCETITLSTYRLGSDFYQVEKNSSDQIEYAAMLYDEWHYSYQNNSQKAAKSDTRITGESFGYRTGPDETQTILNLESYAKIARYLGTETINSRSTYKLEISPDKPLPGTDSNDVTQNTNSANNPLVVTFTIWVDTETYLPLKYQELVEKDGTTFTAYQTQTNVNERLDPAKADDLFHFVLPDGIQVVDITNLIEKQNSQNALFHPNIAQTLKTTTLQIALPNHLPDGYGLQNVLVNNADSVQLNHELQAFYPIDENDSSLYEQLTLLYGTGELDVSGLRMDEAKQTFFDLRFSSQDPQTRSTWFVGSRLYPQDSFAVEKTTSLNGYETSYLTLKKPPIEGPSPLILSWKNQNTYVTLAGIDTTRMELEEVAQSLRPLSSNDETTIQFLQQAVDKAYESMNSVQIQPNESNDFSIKLSNSMVSVVYPDTLPADLRLHNIHWLSGNDYLTLEFTNADSTREIDLYVTSYPIQQNKEDFSFVNLWKHSPANYNQMQPIDVEIDALRGYLYAVAPTEYTPKIITLTWNDGYNYFILVSYNLSSDETLSIARSLKPAVDGSLGAESLQSQWNKQVDAEQTQREAEVWQNSTFVVDNLTSGETMLYYPFVIPSGYRLDSVMVTNKGNDADGSLYYTLTNDTSKNIADISAYIATTSVTSYDLSGPTDMNLEQIDLDGTNARLFSPKTDDQLWSFLNWNEPGVSIQITFAGIDRSTILYFAKGIKKIDPTDQTTLELLQSEIDQSFVP